ncbi:MULTISPECIES: site-specific DNA-methyltransferase [Bradyrhizobium]|uniref:site-specific DNA-methyltransferase n=1 Tax=Bradyrhizobium TaxID=374 RepID=UPI0027D5CE25|nr:DNA modification methylase [Bradyrhizobium sp. TM233]GMO63366.1 DNA modification methylase [Bradyrhizobium ottawaense]GMO94529.1 DNA modification methylase [Bradyrhizobium ottawaense]GMP10952.1 DNA modification methylase [Bradyrhizobium ottawaense]GMP20633.1 DNA modification methylase [Bradyrhizobium ottawaense]
MPIEKSNSPRLCLDYLPVQMLTKNARNPRRHPQQQIDQITKSINTFGVLRAVGVDENFKIIYGNAVVTAAQQLGISELPVVIIRHLSPAEKRAFALADNKIAANGTWDLQLLREELQVLVDLNFDFDAIGFDTPEIDLILDQPSEDDDRLPELGPAVPTVSRRGDVWRLGSNRLICGDALDEQAYKTLLHDQRARAVIADPPYNVAVDGHVGGRGSIKHREFAMASGEMTPQQFTEFLTTACALSARYSVDGSLHYISIDWRHSFELLTAARRVYTEHKNTCVWAKTNAGMGSFYRSQHELVHVFKNGTAAHINNIELGVHGRNRTNLWTYQGINSFGQQRDELLALHPTVKPVVMIADVMKDCTRRGDLVLDPFAGSGTTVIAAEKTGRRAALLEIDPLYCDVIVRRWQNHTGQAAICVSTGRSFADREAAAAALTYSRPLLLPGPSRKGDARD